MNEACPTSTEAWDANSWPYLLQTEGESLLPEAVDEHAHRRTKGECS